MINEESEFAKLKKAEPEKDKDEEKEELLKRADDKFDKESPEEEPEDKEDDSPKGDEDPEDKEDSDTKSKDDKKEPEDECDDDDEDCKKKKEVKESKMNHNMKLMVDMSTDIISEVEINEATSDKTYVIKGTFSSPGKKNRNGRVYSRDIWENNVAKYQDEIKNNTINTLSELEHPPRSTVDQWEAVAKTRLLEMRDGIVYGEMEILNNNDKKTNQIKALIDAGISIGVSTRGVGRMKGSIVEEYNLITTDIVSNPSDYGANLQGFNESMILESQDYSIEEGKIVCTPEGCTVNEAKKENCPECSAELDKKDIAKKKCPSCKADLTKYYKKGYQHESTKETPCSQAADSLLESMNSYSAPEVELSEAQKLAMKIVGKDTIVEKHLGMNEAKDLGKILQKYVTDKKITQKHLDAMRKTTDDKDLLDIFKALLNEGKDLDKILQQYVTDKKITQKHLDAMRKTTDDKDLLDIFKALLNEDLNEAKLKTIKDVRLAWFDLVNALNVAGNPMFDGFDKKELKKLSKGQDLILDFFYSTKAGA